MFSVFAIRLTMFHRFSMLINLHLEDAFVLPSKIAFLFWFFSVHADKCNGIDFIMV